MIHSSKAPNARFSEPADEAFEGAVHFRLAGASILTSAELSDSVIPLLSVDINAPLAQMTSIKSPLSAPYSQC